jgi:hypothetical protein
MDNIKSAQTFGPDDHESQAAEVRRVQQLFANLDPSKIEGFVVIVSHQMDANREGDIDCYLGGTVEEHGLMLEVHVESVEQALDWNDAHRNGTH